MWEVVGLQKVEHQSHNLVVHDDLDLDVSALKIAVSLVSRSRSVSGGDGVALGSEVCQVSYESWLQSRLSNNRDKLALLEIQRPTPSISPLSDTKSGIPTIKLNGNVIPRLAVR